VAVSGWSSGSGRGRQGCGCRAQDRGGSAFRRSPNLLALNEAAEADRAKRVGEQFGAIFPGVVQYTTDVLFRDLWLRPGLAPRDRSLVTVSSLIASGQVAQLTGHLNIGMNNGLTQTEIAEAITHLAFYVGWPNVFSAMPVAKDVFDKRPH
jgi:4-carboxymuconolactone decarboxylase